MPFLTPGRRGPVFQYLLPLLATGVAALVTWASQPWVAPAVLPCFILAVVATALWAGVVAGAITSLLSLAALYAWFLESAGAASLSPADRARSLSFLSIALGIVGIAGSVQAQRARLNEQVRENDRLRGLAEEEAARAREAALEAEMASQEAAEALSQEAAADAALRASEEELADFFETASIGLHWVGEDGTILRANRAELDLLGYPSDEYVGRNIVEFHADRPMIDDFLRRLLAGERIQQYPARLRCKSGQLKDVLIDSSGYFQEGRFVHTRCFTRDVTEEKQIRDASMRLAAIVASSSDAIVGKTLEGEITSWNDAAERIFGYTAAEMVGQSVFKLIPPELHPVERDVLERLRRGETVEVSESARIRKDGRRIWISLSVSPVRSPTGQITGAASIKRDITERKAMDEHLRDSQRLQAVGQLAGGMAHEANNQMSVVLGGAHFLRRRPELSESARQDVDLIRHAAERTASIAQQLLAFSRRQVLEPRDIDLNSVVDSISPMLRRSLEESHQLVIRQGRLGAKVRADPRQLEQVLLNLTLNARDAMPDGGAITISTYEAAPTAADAEQGGPPPGTYEVLAVEDTGHGMDPRTLDRVFEPFFTTKEVGRGTGLGLSVVHGIVSQSGGHIRVRSAPGLGAVFTLYFPAAPPTLEPASPPPEAPRAHEEGAIVLVVEDDPLVRGMAARALTEAGYGVLEAANGRAGLDLVRQHAGRLDLVLSDVGMPEMNGHDLARQLHGERPALPVMLMTGYGGGDHRERAAPDSVRGVVQKPLSPESLVEAVGEVLARASS